MTTLTAIIKAKAGHEAEVRSELLKVVQFARNREPGNTAYELIESDDPCIFVTWESYKDRAAMEAHNQGAAVSDFVDATKGKIEGIEIHIGEPL